MTTILRLIICCLAFEMSTLPTRVMAKTQAKNEVLLDKLGTFIEQRGTFSKQKEERINNVRRQLQGESDEKRLAIYNQMFQEYYTYRFDSAMKYVDKMHQLAVHTQNKHYKQLAAIHRALLLSTGGYYSQAEQTLKNIPQKELDSSLIYEYNITAYWVYNYWSDYCHDDVYSPLYNKEKGKFLAEAVRLYPDKHAAEYYYLIGEMLYWRKSPTRQSSLYYQKALKSTTLNTRTYASAAYALARNYKQEGRYQAYEAWLIRAAMSDQVCPLKENLALQELAMHLFQQDESNAKRASEYIYCSMEDAQFYNNRLRMLEISKRLPAIVSVYEKQLQSKQQSITYATVLSLLLAAALLVGIIFIWKQNKKLNKRGIEIDFNNKELAKLNEKLRKTDATREKYMRLFMDLCAIYIGKINNYRKLVVRKIKAKQVEDLLHKSNSERLTEAEASEFYLRFDKAFLELFPTFIDEFNTLLRPEEQIKLSPDGGLTTELRIYALMRLGVTDSSEIATLLFYSPQTIYNYRTATKKKLIDKEHFDADLAQICKYTQRD